MTTLIIYITTSYLCISGASRGRPVRRWNRYASMRCYSGSVLIVILIRGVGHEYECSGRDDVVK